MSSQTVCVNPLKNWAEKKTKISLCVGKGFPTHKIYYNQTNFMGLEVPKQCRLVLLLKLDRLEWRSWARGGGRVVRPSQWGNAGRLQNKHITCKKKMIF